VTENADARLARVETALQTLVEEVRLLRDSMQDVGSRLTRLEESTRDAVPQVWRLRERVAELEKETEGIKLQLEQLKSDNEKQRQDYEKRQVTTGNRWWDIVKMALNPIIAGLVGAWLALRWPR
jgi:chromosome segregation ATPase